MLVAASRMRGSGSRQSTIDKSPGKSTTMPYERRRGTGGEMGGRKEPYPGSMTRHDPRPQIKCGLRGWQVDAAP